MTYHVIIVRNVVEWVSSPADGGAYDMKDACSRCGTGAVRVDPVFVPVGFRKTGLFSTHKLQILVSQDIFTSLREAGVGSLRQAVNYDREPVELWSVEPEAVLSPWCSESRGYLVERQCPQCKRDGFFDTLSASLALTYACIPDRDVLATWEHFGNSRLRSPFTQSVFAMPRLIVSGRVREVLVSCAGVEFTESESKTPNKTLETNSR